MFRNWNYSSFHCFTFFCSWTTHFHLTMNLRSGSAPPYRAGLFCLFWSIEVGCAASLTSPLFPAATKNDPHPPKKKHSLLGHPALQGVVSRASLFYWGSGRIAWCLQALNGSKPESARFSFSQASCSQVSLMQTSGGKTGRIWVSYCDGSDECSVPPSLRVKYLASPGRLLLLQDDTTCSDCCGRKALFCPKCRLVR